MGKTGNGAFNKLINVDSNGVGEIACGARSNFMGYHKDPDKTRDSFTEDFWFRTGDQASVDQDGFITIRGRIKEIIVTSGGKNVAPVPIEDRIKTALGDLIGNVVVIGNGQNYLTCLITFKNDTDPKTMEPSGKLAPSALRWINSVLGANVKHGIETAEDFIMSEHADKLTAAIWRQMEKVNAKGGSKVETVQKFTVLPTELTVAGGEVSPTMKVKRFFVEKKFAGQIANMYDNNVCLNRCANLTDKIAAAAAVKDQEEY